MTEKEVLSLIEQAFAEECKALDLSYMRLTKLPPAIGKFSHLRILDLSENQIAEIPDFLGQLTNLTELDLSLNPIREISPTLGQLTNLTVLYLSDNEITEIPPTLGQLKNLIELDLSLNQLTKIPSTLEQLTNLTELYLSHNQLTEIPNFLWQLTNLIELDLSHNQLTEIPDWLETLPNLEKLDLRENPLPIPPEILGSPNFFEDPAPVEQIFNYLRQLHQSQTRPLNEAKLLLVGQATVGKTSLVNRLLHNTYDTHQSQTDGLNVTTWDLPVDDKNVRLHVWDFGGQEIYHATHQFFLTKRSLYLLVCNCRTSEEENRLEYWLKLIDTFGGQSPVIIVGNKKDEQPLDINRTALRKKYPNIKHILETSCDTGEGIAELRQTITQEIGQLEDVDNLLPSSWFEVKEELEEMAEDFISYAKYVGICHNRKITEEQNQEQLIDLLHRLGLVLNFRNHSILQNTKVLNPDWVTEGIYALLSDDILKTKAKGILSYADMSRILNPQRYPANRHNYLIELMKQFQLCFPLEPPTPQRFLIPALLPKDEPKDTMLTGDVLEFQYHYRVLPENVISRFIVLTHEKIHQQIYWRSGVMLAYTQSQEIYNLARIRADFEDKRIFISINGRETTRRIFLSIIREVFNKIHRDFANLEVSEWVPVPSYPNHPPLDYEELLGLEKMGISEHPIGKLGITVNLPQLLNGYEPIEARQRRPINDRDPDKMRESGTPPPVIIYNTNQQGDYQPVSTYTNNNQGANIANQVNEAKDNAKVEASNFTQTSGTSTQELLQILASMRQLSAKFPPEVQEDIIVDIEDVEAEVKKPDNQRNKTRLKKRLAALAGVATLVATPVVDMTEFANSAVDLAEKVGIEIQVPPTPALPKSSPEKP